MAAPSDFSWLREVVVPAFFIVIGSALGFIASQLRDDRKATLAKQAFIRAIGMELDALGNQLDASLHEVKGSAERLKAGRGPQFAFAFRTSVYTSQVGKLRSVDDPLMIEIIHFYSDLGTLQHIFEAVNEHSSEFNRTEANSESRGVMGGAVWSGLKILEEQIAAFGSRLRTLRAKLPSAPSDDSRNVRASI